MRRLPSCAIAVLAVSAGVFSAGAARADSRALCAGGSEPVARVDLLAPENYSGILTYTGEVSCNGASVVITSLTITPLGDHTYPSAGTARCSACTAPVTLRGQVPAETSAFEVTMRFQVRAGGGQAVSATRIGRFIAAWGGLPTEVCAGDGSTTSCPA